MFEYYTFLHHSQTITYRFRGGGKFEYHTFYIILKRRFCKVAQYLFEYHTFYIILKP